MKDVNISKENSFTDISVKMKVQSNCYYSLSTNVIGLSGKPYSAYFGIVQLNNKEEEIDRKIKWLNNFSGKNYIIKLVFRVPDNCFWIKTIYRINSETPIKNTVHFKLESLEKINLIKIQKVKEDFDSIEDYTLPRLRELTIDEESCLEKNLVWIFGSPRSGTSWLAGQLLSYKTKFMNEPLIGQHIASLEPYLLNKKVIRLTDFHKSNPDYFFSQRYKESWIFYLRKFILNRIFCQFIDLSNKIIIKEPNGSFAADIILECLPNSKMVCLIRDGRDVIDSQIDSLQDGSWSTKMGFFPLLINEREQFIKTHSNLWLKNIETSMNAYNQHNNDLRFFLKYEDLLSNTKFLTKKLYLFLGINVEEDALNEIIEKYDFAKIPEKMKGSGKVTRIALPGSWRKNLTNEEKILINSILAPKLLDLGYDI